MTYVCVKVLFGVSFIREYRLNVVFKVYGCSSCSYLGVSAEPEEITSEYRVHYTSHGTLYQSWNGTCEGYHGFWLDKTVVRYVLNKFRLTYLSKT